LPAALPEPLRSGQETAVRRQRSGDSGQELRPAELRDHSALLLDRVGLAEGWQAIDLGCGPSGILDLLADRVGPTGQVVGLDFEPANVALAREFTAERRLANVEVVQGDAHRTDFPLGSFDLVHARTLLINIPDPAAVVAEMARLARPGGWVAVLEPDGGGSVCYPAHPAWDRLTEIFRSAQEVDGADTFIGRRLPELLRLAGLTDIGVEAKADIYPAGHSRRTIRADLVRSMRPKILAGGIAGHSELDEVDRAVREHLSDPNTLMLPHLLFLAWGRKPAAPGYGTWISGWPRCRPRPYAAVPRARHHRSAQPSQLEPIRTTTPRAANAFGFAPIRGPSPRASATPEVPFRNLAEGATGASGRQRLTAQ
jgi:SAM-dependent methyltransferase